ncbi:hypothetical protein D3C83_245650 [compost metagenome]
MPLVAAVGQVFGVGADAVLVHERADLAHEGLVERRGPADGQRQAMAHEGEALGQGAEAFAQCATH